MRQPVVGPAPVHRKQLVMLVDHLVRVEGGDAEPRAQGLGLDAVLDRQQAGLVAVAQRLVGLLGGRARSCADPLGKRQIRIAAIELEHHRIVGQAGRNQKLHRRPVDVGDRHAGRRLDQRAQPDRRREDPLRGLRLRATGLGLVRPQHRPVAAVGADRQLDLAHLVTGMPQLPQAFELWVTFRHILKGLSLCAQLTFLGYWPGNSLAL